MLFRILTMPIGVPRIIYCWGEELPAQWTDIYNFIFRRRMVFLMQYLDDELCNQICGLLINIHMEDRSKELEKKETGTVFKSGTRRKDGGPTSVKTSGGTGSSSGATETNKGFSRSKTALQTDTLLASSGENIKDSNGSFVFQKQRSMEDLLNADEDLGIEEIDTLEQYTLQKITTEWLNWNAQFFDYSDEPYLFYLAELFSKDFNKNIAKMSFNDGSSNSSYNKVSKVAQLLQMLQKNTSSITQEPYSNFKGVPSITSERENLSLNFRVKEPLSIYTPFRALNKSSKQSIISKDLSRSLFALLPYNQSSITVNSEEALISLATQEARSTTASPLLGGGPENLKNNNNNNNNKASTLPLTTPLSKESPNKLLKIFYDYQSKQKLKHMNQDKTIYKLITDLSQNGLISRFSNIRASIGSSGALNKANTHLNSSIQTTSKFETQQKITQSSLKTLSQRKLKRDYSVDSNFSTLTYDSMHKQKNFNSLGVNNKDKFDQENITNPIPLYSEKEKLTSFSNKSILDKKHNPYKKYLGTSTREKTNQMSFSYLNSNVSGEDQGTNEFRSYYRKQTERTFIEEESKKVFVIINSFGGSVGNGVTVHDALQFIKAGSLTLGLGVAASAASLALAGGTIGERYVTEGCHVMIHQPEGGLQGQASDIWIDSQEIMKIRLDVAEIYSLSTYRPRHKILRDLDRDFYLTATETIHYGLADEIATNEVMHEIIEMTSKVWDYHDSKQQRLLESRESASSGADTQTQN